MFMLYVLFYLQVEWLDLRKNPIRDLGASKLLGCLSNVKKSTLIDCNISAGMTRTLIERGREVGCSVDV